MSKAFYLQISTQIWQITVSYQWHISLLLGCSNCINCSYISSVSFCSKLGQRCALYRRSRSFISNTLHVLQPHRGVCAGVAGDGEGRVTDISKARPRQVKHRICSNFTGSRLWSLASKHSDCRFNDRQWHGERRGRKGPKGASKCGVEKHARILNLQTVLVPPQLIWR